MSVHTMNMNICLNTVVNQNGRLSFHIGYTPDDSTTDTCQCLKMCYMRKEIQSILDFSTRKRLQTFVFEQF